MTVESATIKTTEHVKLYKHTNRKERKPEFGVL